MNTWLVGAAPIGHYIVKPRYNTERTSIIESGQKTFFMKGRIMAGQADVTENLFGLASFKWLTREEIERTVSPKYYSSVRNMLADR
jgi:large subunit ribosomal protein L46